MGVFFRAVFIFAALAPCAAAVYFAHAATRSPLAACVAGLAAFCLLFTLEKYT